MASFTKMENGWRARVRKNGASLSKVFPTKAMAQAWATKEENDLMAVVAGLPTDKTIADLFAAYKKKAPSESVRIDRIAASVDASKKLKSLDAQLVQKWQADRLEKVSSASVLRERKAFSAAINFGVKKLKWLKENPFLSTDSPPDGSPKKSVWSDSQIELFLHASGYRESEVCVTDTSRVGASLVFALETAMRSSEICRARREDIAGRVLHIPKTKNGEARDIPLSAKAIRIIEQLPEIGDTLFSLTDASRDALFRKIRDRATVTGVDFHSARRTALTRLSKKFDVLTLAKISGHKDIRILLKHYYAPSIEGLAARLDEA